jgi:uncharacterized membrane protein YoaK (UPF0700 family)
VKLALLIAYAALAIHFGPFTNGDVVPAVLTGMGLIAAMAIQNAAHRIHLCSAPPSTLMPGTTTQIMIDLADMLQPPRPETGVPGQRLAHMDTAWALSMQGQNAPDLQRWIRIWCVIEPYNHSHFLKDPATGGAASFGQSASEKDRQDDHDS